MNKFLQKLKMLSVLVILMAAADSKAQLSISVNNGLSYQCDQGGNNTANAVITVTVPGATSYSWTVSSTTCPPTFTTMGIGVSITAPCVGLYSVCCTAYNGASIVGFQCGTFSVVPNPVVSISNSGPSNVCAGTGVTLTASGATSYTWTTPFPYTGATLVQYPWSPTCYTLAGEDSFGCMGMASTCVSVMPAPNITIAGNQNVCLGSSTTFTASGASGFVWSNSVSGPTLYSLPLTYTNYTVTGTGSNGCVGHMTVGVVVDTTCADVWPGDANSDGVVDNTDVLELGLAFNDTGAPRVPGGNAYTSQYAATWVGYVSSGKNKCHADCNGDGTINLGDTLAIFNNYSLTHAFKSSEASAATGDINFGTSPGNIVVDGTWNKIDILLGSSASAMSQLYGVAFDVNFDNTLIQTNSAHIVYTSSFLNASNPNVEFKKLNYAGGKIYAASVRSNGNNVNGFGKIGEFWFKLKPGVTASTLNLSLSNSSIIGNTGVKTSLVGSTAAFNIVEGPSGVTEQNVFENAVSIFPNPATNQLTLRSVVNESVNYIICDITGREVVKGQFTDSKTVDVTALSAGTYLVRLQSGSSISNKKLVIEK